MEPVMTAAQVRIFNRMLLTKLYLGKELSEEELDIVNRRKVFVRVIETDRAEKGGKLAGGVKRRLVTLTRKKGIQVLDQVDERVLLQYKEVVA